MFLNPAKKVVLQSGRNGLKPLIKIINLGAKNCKVGRIGLTFLYVEQDVNLAQQSCSGLKNVKIAEKNFLKIREKVVLQSGRNGLMHSEPFQPPPAPPAPPPSPPPASPPRPLWPRSAGRLESGGPPTSLLRPGAVGRPAGAQSWALSVFFILFSITDNYFLHFLSN